MKNAHLYFYLTFSADHDRTNARARFVERYGHPPAGVYLDDTQGLQLLRVGPVGINHGLPVSTETNGRSNPVRSSEPVRSREQMELL